MRPFHDEDFKPNSGSFRAGLMMLGFGLAVLGFLVAIDRPEWFHLRPMTGTAVAMAQASTLAEDGGNAANASATVAFHAGR